MNKYFDMINSSLNEYRNFTSNTIVNPLEMLAFYGIEMICSNYSVDKDLPNNLQGYFGVQVTTDENEKQKYDYFVSLNADYVNIESSRMVISYCLAGCLIADKEKAIFQASRVLGAYLGDENNCDYNDEDEYLREEAMGMFVRELLMPKDRFCDTFNYWKDSKDYNKLVRKLADVFSVPKSQVKIRIEELALSCSLNKGYSKKKLQF